VRPCARWRRQKERMRCQQAPVSRGLPNWLCRRRHEKAAVPIGPAGAVAVCRQCVPQLPVVAECCKGRARAQRSAAASRCTAAHQRSSRIQCAAMPFLHATRCTPSSVSVTQLHLPWHLCSPLRYLEIAHVRRYCSLCSAACTPLCRRYYAALEMHSSSWFVRQMMVCMPLPAHVGAGPARRLCR